MKTRMLTIAASAALMLSLSACTNAKMSADSGFSAQGSGSEKGTATVELSIKNIDDAVVDLDKFGDSAHRTEIVDGVLIYEAAGSGSCKPIVETATLEDQKLTLTKFDYTGKPCTMDLRHFRQEIKPVDGSALPADLNIVVVDPTTF